jgi:ankyrin repeat protein
MSALPSSPDLSFEKKHAKSLLRAIRGGDAAALARLMHHLPRAGTREKVTLADAQFVIARERGFESWPKLKAHIEAARPMAGQAELLLQAVRDDKSGVVARLLRAHPGLRAFDIFTASASGSADEVARMVVADRAEATRTHTKEEWTPLAYACRSRAHLLSVRHAADIHRIVTLLLDAGVSANSGSVWFEGDGRKVPIPALYHACMADHPALVDLLLARGANPNDGESTYHAAQFNRQACLEVLRARGADLSFRQAPYGNTPLYFLAGHQSDEGGQAAWFKGFVWLLEHGADPNAPSYAKAEAPLHLLASGFPKLATVDQLLAHGADPNLKRADGRTPYDLAVRHGNTAIAERLRNHGADPSGLSTIDRFLGACLAADEPAARALLEANPDLLTSMGAHAHSALTDGVAQGHEAAIRLMVALGFRLDAQAPGGGTALHHAAWQGRVTLVRALLSLGAPIDVLDTQFGSSPLGWAAHGSACHAGRDDDYLTIVDALISAGAERAASFNRWGVPPEGLASPKVAERFKAWASA